MIIIPAIDLRGGACVRLVQGDYDRETIYSSDPLAMARKWRDAGAKRLHLVDLDGALKGYPAQKELIIKIVQEVLIPVEVGGGIRDQETITFYLENGVDWVILGSAAADTPELLSWACDQYPDRIILGLDARDGVAAIEGWRRTTAIKALELAAQAASVGVKEVIYTDISRDGALTGPNLFAIEEMARKSGLSVIASGGVSSLSDLWALKRLAPLGVNGVVVGKALYNGAINLSEAIRQIEGELDAGGEDHSLLGSEGQSGGKRN